MPTIAEAIEILEAVREHDEHSNNATKKATRLAIEALKEIKRHRAFPGTAQVWRLTGETE